MTLASDTYSWEPSASPATPSRSAWSGYAHAVDGHVYSVCLLFDITFSSKPPVIRGQRTKRADRSTNYSDFPLQALVSRCKYTLPFSQAEPDLPNLQYPIQVRGGVLCALAGSCATASRLCDGDTHNKRTHTHTHKGRNLCRPRRQW